MAHANLTPNPPTNLVQQAYPGAVAIPEGGSTGAIITLIATISDPDLEDRPYVDFEIRRGNRTDFATSLRCPGGNTCTLSINSDPLPNNSYTWRARTRDPFGAVSAWVEFGTAATTDFVVNLSSASGGTICAAGTQCASGFCADARCCNTACNGECEACDAALQEGTCVAYANGTDPDYECSGDGTCGGYCNGARACNTAPSGQQCNTYCSGTTFYDYDCNGSGYCSYVGSTSCSPYLCNGSGYGASCKTTCSGTFDCVSGAICVSGQCVLLAANGASCSNSAECQSGFCTDGVCCNQACLGTCEQCSSSGICQAIANGQDPANECSGAGACGGVCNGARACGFPSTTTSCGTTTCVNAVLSGQTCDGAGTCIMSTASCSPYACNNQANGCRTSCTNNSHCASGATCSGGQCVGLSAVGAACGQDGECASGYCADGYCCSTRCNGTCERCDDTPGTCTDAAAGTDPHGDCSGTSATCAGSCNGAGACTGYPLGVPCGAPSCSSEYVVDLACDGAGNCLAMSADCQPYACDPGSTTCRSSCTTDAQCAPGHTCRNGSCQPLPGNGSPCTSADQCASGYCVDGFCCNAPCAGVCRACDVAGQEGACRYVPDNMDPDFECAGDGVCGGTCNGLGACEAPSGGSCGAPACGADQLTTFACDGAGACLPSIANCAPYACDPSTSSCFTVCDDDSQCASGLGCVSGVCVPLLPIGVACGADVECVSGYCVDGVCCNNDCAGSCSSCSLARTLGLCTPIAAGNDPEDECPGSGSCGGSCDGNGACAFPTLDSPCGVDQCVGSVMAQSRCDGAGGCQASAIDCAPYACADGACLDQCGSDSDCATGYLCMGGSCSARPDAGVPDAAPVDSGPPPAVIIHHTANATAAVGIAYAYDPDGRAYASGQPTITWSACDAPPGFRIEPSSGVVSWTPASVGTFSVCLRAVSPYDDDEYSYSITVVEPPPDVPNAVLDADPIEGPARLSVSFDGTQSTPVPGSQLLGFEWTFGDGSARNYDPTTSHDYVLPGGYVSRLKVTDVLGVSDVEPQTIAVFVPPNVRPPLAQIQASATSGSEPLEVQFGCDCQAGDTAIVSYLWTFGDGTISSEPAPRNIFHAGTYEVTLEVVDQYGLSGIDRITVVASQAENVPPQCYVAATPPAGSAPLDVAFSAVFYDPDGDIAARGWTFDDGYQSTEPTMFRYYATPGNHFAEFRAVDSLGAPCTARVDVTVLSDDGVRAPRIVSQPNTKTTCFEPYRYDADGLASAIGAQPMTWTIGQRIGDQFIGAPAGMSVDPSTGEVIWVPPVGSPFTDHVVLTVRNTAGIDVQSFDVEVECGGILSGDGGDKSDCACSTTDHPRSSIATGLLLLGLLFWRRPRRSRWLAMLIASWPASASANVTPYLPDQLAQRTEAGTAIAEGGSAPARITLTAHLSDFDCEDTLYADFELLVGGIVVSSIPGSCVPSTNGQCPPNDCSTTIMPSNLANGSYVWRVRTRDVLGDVSAWREFGTAGITDFVVNINNAANGTACAAGTQCASGNCIDGYCCNTACSSTCQSCSLTNTIGTCTNIPNGQDPQNECAGTNAICGGQCNGAGACVTPTAGTSCGSEWCSGSSHYGYECDGLGSCIWQYDSCSPYTCTNQNGCRTSCTNSNQCAYGAICVQGQCRIPGANGAVCATGIDCASGFCADGVCCNSACGGLCESCNNASGTCTPITSGSDPAEECAGTGVCGGACDGAGGCGFPSTTVSCGATNCSNAMISGFVCDGGGMCISSAGDCGAYQCLDATTCRTSCTLSSECSGGATCIGGRCIGATPDGQPCAADGECASGFCVDGVCCRTQCAEPCRSCAVAGQLGSCAMAPAGSDVRGDCDGDHAACSGACDGSGGCTAPAGACGSAICLGDSLVVPTCSGGSCSGTTIDCFPYTCNTTTIDCRTTCTSNLDCAEGARCAGGICVGLREIGEACAVDGECRSGRCADGVCCDAPCAGACEACNLAGFAGRCTFVPPGTDPDNECPGQQPCGGECDGGGACATIPQGVPCGTATCGGDGVVTAVCDGAGFCTNATEPCALYTCDPSGPVCYQSCTTNAECSPFAACDGNTCLGLLPPGRGCTAGSQCGSGHCVDGVCCDTACTGACETCSLTGALGRCTFWPAGQDPEDECNGTGTCGGTCDGAGACSYPSIGSSCGAELCVGNALTTAQCDGLGSCVGNTGDCAPYLCNTGACTTSCASDDDCSPGARCYGSSCSFPDAGFPDVGPDAGPIVEVEIDETANLVAIANVSYAYDEDRTATAIGAPTIQWSRCGGPVNFRVELETGIVSWTPATSGTFELCVRAENGDDFDEYRFNVEVLAPEQRDLPMAVLNATPDRGPAPLTVSFDATGSQPSPGSSILSLRWTFGDGSRAVYGQATSFEYALAGTYVSRLQVTDVLGLIAQADHAITVLDGDRVPPSGRIIVSESSGTRTLAVTFRCDCQAGSAPIAEIQWDFGDGTISTEAEPTKVFQPGNREVSLLVVDEAGLTAMDQLTIEVREPEYVAPQCNASAAPSSGAVPLDVNFDAVFFDPDGAIAEHTWTFDDGLESPDIQTQRRYGTPGTYRAYFRAVDETGLPCVSQVTITALSEDGHRAPQILSVPSTTVRCGELYQYDADGRATAVGAEPKTWSVGQRVGSQMIGVPSGFLIDGETGAVTWTPAYGPPRAEFVVLSVANPGGTDGQEFTVQVDCDGQVEEKKSSRCRCDHTGGTDETGATALLLLALALMRRRRLQSIRSRSTRRS